MKPESLIFDIDGTLWDNREVSAASYNKQLIDEGFAHLATVTADQLLTLFGKTLPEIADLLFDSVPAPRRYRLIETCTERSLVDFETDPTLVSYPGVAETLEELAKHYRLFIVSNSELGYPQLTMGKLGITHLFQGHMCHGDTGLPKGQTLLQLKERHQIENGVYIGDTQGDLEAARTAGLPFVWCSYGFGQPEAFDARVDSFRELLDLFPGK